MRSTVHLGIEANITFSRTIIDFAKVKLSLKTKTESGVVSWP